MGRADYYREGDWNAVCSMCGFKFKASELRQHWQGMYRCERCWEARHPQDFVQAVPDHPAAPWVQQQQTTTFIHTCHPNARTGMAGWAVADCAIPDFIDPALDPNASYLG